MKLLQSMKCFWILGAAWIALLGCYGCEGNNEVEKLKAETMQIHDEAMKENGTMNTLGRTLKKYLVESDSLSPRRDSLRDAVLMITKANEGMNNWMVQYEEPDASMPKEQAIAYLKEQNRLIGQNKQDILAAIRFGQKLQK